MKKPAKKATKPKEKPLNVNATFDQLMKLVAEHKPKKSPK